MITGVIFALFVMIFGSYFVFFPINVKIPGFWQIVRLQSTDTKLYLSCLQHYHDFPPSHCGVYYAYHSTVPWGPNIWHKAYDVKHTFKTHHYNIFFVLLRHSKPGMESFCSPGTDYLLWVILIMFGCVLSQLKPRELYILSCEKASTLFTAKNVG